MLGELQDAKDRRLGGMSMILREIKSQLTNNETMRTALDEIYTAGTLLIQSFIPNGPVRFDLTSGNKLLEYTCRQKKPFSFLKDVMKCLEMTVMECIALCFDSGYQNIIHKPPTLSNITQIQADTVSDNLKLPDRLNSRAFEQHLQSLYKFWVMIAEGSGPGMEVKSESDKAASSGAAIASNVAPPKIEIGIIENLKATELDSLLRTIFHLLSTPNVDARPANQTVIDRIMFFLSSLNTRMPERQNSIREMYSWTVLTPYVEELVIYTPEELELPNAEGITADFYLRTTHKKEWTNFLERLACDPFGGDASYRLLQKREWCSFRGQTLLRTVRGMLYYEKAVKILSLLEMAKGGHWTPAQERMAKHISQRKFQYVLSCQKYGAFKQARERRERGELLDRPNLPDSVRIERKKLLDEAQKCDDIEYILRKYPHLRIAYVDDYTKDGQRAFASVLVKAMPRPVDDEVSGLIPAIILNSAKSSTARREVLLARARVEQARQEELGSMLPGIHGQGYDIGAGVMIDDIDADKSSFTAAQLKPEPKPERKAGSGSDSADIQEIYRVRLPGPILIGEGKPENQNHAMIFTRGEFLEAIDMNQDNYLEEAFKMRNLLEEFDPLREDDKVHHRDEIRRPSPVQQGSNGVKASKNGVLKCAILGFRENIFTANLMSVGTYMSLMEATFVSMTLRTFAWLGSRMHYGHPDCLSFGTRVARADGTVVLAEDITENMELVGEDGAVAVVDFAEHAITADLYKIASSIGEYTVSAGHKVTLRCARGEVEGAIPAKSSLKLDEPDRLLAKGDLVEVTAEALHQQWNKWQMGTSHAIFTGRRVPLPTLAVPSNGSIVTRVNVDSLDATADVALPIVSSDGQVVCTHYTLAVVGDGQYQRPASDTDHSAKIVYQLYNPLKSDDDVSHFGSKNFAFAQLEPSHAALGVKFNHESGFMVTELNPIAAGADAIESSNLEYDQICRATMSASIQPESVHTLVAFGKHTINRWKADAKSLNGVASAVPRSYRKSDGLELTMENGRVIRVLFAAHPCQWSALSQVIHTLAAAHDLPESVADAVIAKGTIEEIGLESIEPVNTPTQIVNIGIKGDNKRYALADGTLTHNCMDKLFFITRGGMSKSSKMLHVSEDIFAGFKSTLRGGRILHKEYIQCGKGRDLGFNQLFLFEAKLASGAGEQALSREAYRLGRYLDLPRLLSFFYGSIGFYTTTALIVVSIASLLFARMMIALTGTDQRINEFNEQFGTSVGLLHASSVYQLGLLLILPMLAEIALEKTIMKALTTYVWMLVTGASFFFFFHTQTKAFFFNNSVMFGGAKYRATGRGFALSRDSFTRIYRTYARSHFYPAMKLLFMMVVYGIFDHSGLNWFFEMWAPLLLVIAWLYSPMWFNPMSFDHEKVISDFKEWRQWLDRKSMNEENSWQGWWVLETEYLQRTPRTTKLWLVLFNLVFPAVIIAAAISSLEAASVSRVYFLIISVGATVGLVVVALFLVHTCHPVGDTYRWLKFVIGSLILALLIVTIIFDTGSTSFGWKGTNFAVYLIVIALTFNAICKVLMIFGAGPYRFGFCLTWFRYCDIIFGLIIYTPWLFFSFIGLASIQTRLLYNSAFFQGLRISALLRGDPARKEEYREKSASAVLQKKLGPGFTPANMTRENSVEDMMQHGQRSGMNLMVPEHSNRWGANSRNYSHYHSNSPSITPYNGSRRSSFDASELNAPERQGLLRTNNNGHPPNGAAPTSHREDHGGGLSNPGLLIYSQSPSSGQPMSTMAANRPNPLVISHTPNSTRKSALSARARGSAQPTEEEKSNRGAHPRYTYN